MRIRWRPHAFWMAALLGGCSMLDRTTLVVPVPPVTGQEDRISRYDEEDMPAGIAIGDIAALLGLEPSRTPPPELLRPDAVEDGPSPYDLVDEVTDELRLRPADDVGWALRSQLWRTLGWHGRAEQDRLRSEQLRRRID